jgi:hypothetical protein
MSTQSKTGLEPPVTPEDSVLPRRPPVRYVFDPELAPIVEMLPTLAYDDPAAFRQQATEFAAAMMQRPETAVPVEVRDVAVPGPAGAPEVPVRIYAPKRSQDEGASGALVYFHGGGWIGADVAGNDGLTYALAAESGRSWCPSTTAWPPRTPSRPGSRTATRPSSGRSRTPRNWASTPSGSGSAATAPAPTSRPA